jgi:hypothetical protein
LSTTDIKYITITRIYQGIINMSQSPSNKCCESIALFAITSEYLSANESENRKICGICHDELKAGDQVGRNGCCSALACLACLSRAANKRIPESRGGMLPAYAKCQLCGELFDREPLNECVPVVSEEDAMPDLHLAAGGEEINVKIPAATVVEHDTPVEELTEETWYESGNVRVTKTGGTWTYSVGTVDTFIDEDFPLDGTKLDLAGAMAWGRVMTKDVPTEPKITKEEALAGLEEYTIYEWVSDSDDDE